jgi:hypothetical protein
MRYVAPFLNLINTLKYLDLELLLLSLILKSVILNYCEFQPYVLEFII